MIDQGKVEILAAWAGITSSNLYDLFGNPEDLPRDSIKELEAFLDISLEEARCLYSQVEALFAGECPDEEPLYESEDAFLRSFEFASHCVFDFLNETSKA